MIKISLKEILLELRRKVSHNKEEGIEVFLQNY